MDALELLDEIRILASNGLKYAGNEYDRVRYARLLELVEEYYGQALDLPPSEVRERFRAELGHITPKVGSDGAIFDDAGRILLMRRVDTDTWCLPCGWMEPSESPSETGGTLACSPEGLELRYWEIEEVPEWYAHHERLARAARDANDGAG
jgi:hypothetical protein